MGSLDKSNALGLARLKRPAFERGQEHLRVVDLFAGCGGISLGVAQAALDHGRTFDLRVAIDFDNAALGVLKANFPKVASMGAEDVSQLLSWSPIGPPTLAESRLQDIAGRVDLLVGGPPCQGNSSLNNRTRGKDPKNALYFYMVRATAIFRPRAVLVENVPAVERDSYLGENVVAMTRQALESLGYDTAARVVNADRFGVAQKRKRHLLLAVEAGHDPEAMLLALGNEGTPPPTVFEAIGDLVANDEVAFDRAPKASTENVRRMTYLHANGLLDLPNSERPRCQQDAHSYKSVYGRLAWDTPAQTITSGFGSIGQGRYMHPADVRALTAHEAARLQGFPDYFSFAEAPTRSALATMIGNAVPPPITRAVVASLLSSGAL